MIVRLHLPPHHCRAPQISTPSTGVAQRNKDLTFALPSTSRSKPGTPFCHLFKRKRNYDHARLHHLLLIPHLRKIFIIHSTPTGEMGDWVCLSPAEFSQLQQYSECEYLNKERQPLSLTSCVAEMMVSMLLILGKKLNRGSCMCSRRQLVRLRPSSNKLAG